MGTTIIGPTAGGMTATVNPPILRLKRNWSDPWQTAPELELVQASVATAGQDLDAATIRRRYGQIKHPYESAIGTHAPVDLTDYWLRIDFVDAAGLQPAFLGRISGEDRGPWGSDAGPAGVQSWVAYGPLQILRKIHVSRSFWMLHEDKYSQDTSAVEEVELGWLPAMNDRHDDGIVRANRSGIKSDDGVYVYGTAFGDPTAPGPTTSDPEPWTHKQYVEYLLTKFVDESDDDGPSWKLTGQSDILDDMTETFHWGTSRTVAEMLSALIPNRFGVDYRIDFTDEGFEVRVFALNAKEFSYGGKTLPRNPATVRVQTGQTRDSISTRLALSNDHAYKTLRVLGKRLVVCFSLESEFTPGIAGQGKDPTLEGKWRDSVEDDYKQGASGLPDHPLYKGAAYHDMVRSQERFRHVYQAFGAPLDVDAKALKITPDPPTPDSGDKVTFDAKWQNFLRKTLPWLPLRQGYDYTVSPPSNAANPRDAHAEFLGPIALIANMPADYEEDGNYQWFPVETLGIGVSAARNDWGIQLSCSPNHLIAANRFRQYASCKPTNSPPKYDYKTLVCTIAIETDQRLVLELEMPNAKPSDGILEVEAEDAEWWYLAPDTILGVDPANPQDFLRAEGQVLRNDFDRLTMVAAGVIARYYASRARAEIIARGLRPWQGLLGQVLSHVDEGGSSHDINAVITGITWIWPGEGGGSPTTIIRAGFAQ